MLSVENVSLNYDRSILDGISFKVKEGEILGIVGKSGAGKTSLLKIMSGLLQPTQGRVELNGEAVRGPHIKLVPGHPEIQLVNQDFHLDTYHTVEENIREQILYLPFKEREQLVHELLELVELDELKHQKATTLSGGEQQRLALARALACEPKLILLDEPFVHLDGRLRSKLVKYLLDLREIRGTSFVLVSHDGAEMLSLADKVLCMKKGKIYRQGNPKNLYYKPKTIEEGKLFGPINSVQVGDKRILFRPDEFRSDKRNNGIPLDLVFEKAIFNGTVYENYFRTFRKEVVMLYSINNDLSHVKKGVIFKEK
jgi:ABC-type multidrug transport system ATPase subunit